jgi:hypothetical protein
MPKNESESKEFFEENKKIDRDVPIPCDYYLWAFLPDQFEKME